MNSMMKLLIAFIAVMMAFAGCLNDIEKAPMQLPGQAVSAPSGLEARASNGCVTLTWYRAEDAAGYRLYRSDNPNDSQKMIAETTDTFYTDRGLVNGRTYYYSVSAIDAEGLEGKRSQTV
ncbi:MAG: hypothetical protein B6D63_04665, partial [Candidatus Latescibacteria bacterium 4484_7]